MGDIANVIVVRENGTHELYRTGWAVGIDLDLLDGPAAVLAMLPGLRQDGWWSLYPSPQAYQVPELWPSWVVEFWQDDWAQHVRACNRFSPAPFDTGAEARTAVLAEAAERRATRARHRA
jgi:hypothetical protein